MRIPNRVSGVREYVQFMDGSRAMIVWKSPYRFRVYADMDRSMDFLKKLDAEQMHDVCDRFSVRQMVMA